MPDDEPARKARRNPNPPKHKLRLTRAAIAALPIPDAGHLVAWDEEQKGLAVRVSPHGRRTWFWQGRGKGGSNHKVTIGDAKLVSPDVARLKAQKAAIAA